MMNGDCKRKQKRTLENNEFLFSVVDSTAECGVAGSCFTGVLVDRSSTGIGFTTQSRLEPGNRIRLQVRETPQEGVVMWTVNAEDRCRVGVHLIDPSL